MPKAKKPFTLHDKSDAVRRRYENGARRGIDAVMGDCVRDALDNVPVATAALQGSIKVHQDARKEGDEIAGIWGSHDIFYALAVETGDRSYLSDVPKQDKEKDEPPVPTRRNKGNRNFLRGAADRYYPELADRIQEQLGPPVI